MLLTSEKNLSKEIKVGACVLGLFLTWAMIWLFLSYIFLGTPSDPYRPVIDFRNELIPPGSTYLLGTDIYGRSILEVLSEGLVYTLSVSFSVSLLSAAIGTLVGFLTTSSPKAVKIIFDGLTNIVFIFPTILIAILIMSILGESYWGIIFALTVTGWPGYAKIARAESLRILSLEYVEGARAIGMNNTRLFSRVIFPNLLPFILIHFVMSLSGVIISEATLGFLGLGGSEYSWGSLLSMSKGVLLEAPYITVILSLLIGVLIISVNLLGDGLRDTLDPHKD